MYASQFWALRYASDIEKVQLHYLKRLLKLPYNTPNYIVRLETGRVPLIAQVFNLAIKFWVKFLNMNDNRVHKKCFNDLLRIDKDNSYNDKTKNLYNWCSQLRKLIDHCGFSFVWQSQSIDVINKHKNEMLERFKDILRQNDLVEAQMSSYNSVFHLVKCTPFTAKYLKHKVSLDVVRVICQARAKGNVFRIKGIKYELADVQVCSLCNLHENEDFFHFLTRCKIYE